MSLRVTSSPPLPPHEQQAAADLQTLSDYLRAYITKILDVPTVDTPSVGTTLVLNRIPTPFKPSLQMFKVDLDGEAYVVDKTDENLVGPRWFLLSDLVEAVDEAGGPVHATREEQLFETYGSKAASALSDLGQVFMQTGKAAPITDSKQIASLNALETSARGFMLHKNFVHAYVVVHGDLFARVESDATGLPLGWYRLPQ